MSLMLMAAIVLWSPLSALGLVPFFLAGLDWRRDLRTLFATRSGLPFLALAALVARYITLDAQTIAHGWAIDQFSKVSTFWFYYSAFCLLEFGVLALLLAWSRAFDAKVAIAVLVLLALPFLHFGAGNDLVMRASIPALAVLALAAVRPLVRSDRLLPRGLLALVLVIGALGAAQEPARALLTPRWALTGRTLAQISADQSPFGLALLPPNYAGHLNQPGLQALLRDPSQVRPYPNTPTRVHP
jgi:hypothetical protein